MRRSRWHPPECKVCGARAPFVSISARGLCPDHTRMRITDNFRDLKAHDGPWFDHWRRRSLAALGVFAPLDEATDEG